MSSLVGKRILLLAPKFFSYENIIKAGIEEKGGIVHLYDERNNATAIQKVIIRKCPVLLNSSINKYYQEIALNDKNFCPDFVLFVSPETVNKESIRNLRQSFPSAKFILYMYDSIENKNVKNIYSFFDTCLSFDQVDCEKYGFKFRPLFYSPEFVTNKDDTTEFKYDFAFIGTIHSDRARILNKIRGICKQKDLKFYYYLYVPSKFLLMIRRVISKDVRQLHEYIHIQSIDKREVSTILSKTKYIIDINHPKQVGLTMRTIEMLGLKKRILTTNENIAGYDFYKESNQIILNRKNIDIDVASITDHFDFVPESILCNYSLSNWVNEVFDVGDK